MFRINRTVASTGGVAIRVLGWILVASGTLAVAQGPPAAFSSSSALPESSSSALPEAPGGSRRVVAPPPSQQQVDLYEGPVRPFSKLGVGAEGGTLGIGLEVVTPLTRTLYLRGGADFLNFGYGLVVDSAQYYGQAHLRSGHMSVDWHPGGGSFRISPGMLVFGSGFSASVLMTGGKSFELGDTAYTSSATDPVHGSATVSMQHKLMPNMTIGWGNVLGQRSHFTIPFEIGAAYTGHYSVGLNLAGTACQGLGCMSTTSPQVQQSVSQEESQLNETMKHYQIYPFISTGVELRF